MISLIRSLIGKKLKEKEQEKQEAQRQDRKMGKFYCKGANVRLNVCRLKTCDLFDTCQKKLSG